MRAAAAVAIVIAGLAAAPDGAGADDDGWDVRVPDEVTVEVGAAGSASLTVAPAPGRTVSRDGPLRLYLEPAPGLEVSRRRLRREQAADAAAEAPRFDLRFRATAAGDHALVVEVRCWLCRRKTCRPVQARRTITVHAVAPAPPAPPPAPAAPLSGQP